MAHRVDHDERRQQLAEAAWRVARSHGVEGLTIRRVGEEAGWTSGAVQYYFPSRSGLLEHAFVMVQTQTLQRLAEVSSQVDDDEAFRTAIYQVLPITDEITTEAEVWFSFLGLALGNPALRSVGHQGQRSVTEAIAEQAKRSIAAGVISADLDPLAVATEGLSLADGLCVNAMCRPDAVGPDQVRSIMERWLGSLR